MMIKKLLYAGMMLAIITGCAGASRKPPADLLLNVYHYKVPGAGESVQLCYVIKKGNGEKEFMYDAIEGFDYQWGYNYTISVVKRVLSNPASDASAIRYRLKKIIKKEKILPTVEFDLPVIFNDQVMVENEKGGCSYFREINIQTGAYSCADLMRAQSATFRHRADGGGLLLVKTR